MIIAFCHAGTDAFPRNADRSTPIDAWRPLWARGHEWWSVLRGGRQSELVNLPPNVTDRGRDARDVADHKAILEQADLVVTVDTLTANLVGRYRLPGIILLSAVPDFRYGTDQWPGVWPWLPTIRQITLGDWSPVFAELERRLWP